MSRPEAPETSMTIFVVRFWREPAAGEMRWRGRVEHVESGARANFLSLDELAGFLDQFGFGETSRRSIAQRTMLDGEESLQEGQDIHNR